MKYCSTGIYGLLQLRIFFFPAEFSGRTQSLQYKSVPAIISSERCRSDTIASHRDLPNISGYLYPRSGTDSSNAFPGGCFWTGWEFRPEELGTKRNSGAEPEQSWDLASDAPTSHKFAFKCSSNCKSRCKSRCKSIADTSRLSWTRFLPWGLGVGDAPKANRTFGKGYPLSQQLGITVASKQNAEPLPAFPAPNSLRIEVKLCWRNLSIRC